MAKVIDYYFSLISPWTYLGGTRLPAIAEKANAAVAVKPVKLAVIFPETGGLPLAKRPPARQAYRLVELERWRKFLNAPLTIKPAHFPADEDLAARLVIAAGGDDGTDPAGLSLAQAILRAVWAEERNIADPNTLNAILKEEGLEADLLEAAAGAPTVTERYDHNTQEALEAGVFGAPSYIYKGELFWGQDRLDFLERALMDA